MKKIGIIDKLRQASEEGNLEAKYSLGEALTGFVSDRAKMDEGIKWLREAGREGHEGALKKLASMEIPLEESPEVPPSPTLEKDKVQPSRPEPPKVKSTKVKPIFIAVSACVLIGLVLFFVLPSMKLKGVEKDASQGKPEAQMALGVRYMEGKGVPIDQVKGMELIKLAAEQDYPEAAEFFRSDLTAKAEKGDPEAQYDLAISYMEGKYLLKVDSSKGWDWAAKAAKQGHKDASEMVIVKERDDLIARAEKGDPQAQYDLAIAYMEGKYLLKVDDTKGFDWMFKAYRQGHEEATKFTLTVLVREANLGSTECIEYLNDIKDLEEIRFLRSLSYYVPLKVLSWGSDSTIPDGIKRSDLIDVSGGWSFSLGLLKDGSLVAWGSDNNITSKTPEGNNFVAISAGSNHGLALKKDGSIVAWGSNGQGQLSIPKGNDFVAVSAGGFHSLALKKDGSMVCWGDNDRGQASTPKGMDFVAISAGRSHSLALKKDGSIVAWGSNSNGECSVPKGNDFVAVSAGAYHSLALKKDGSLLAWGSNSYGQTSVPKGSDFVAISTGGNYSLALRVDGSVAAWGRSASRELEIPNKTSFVLISAGVYHALGLVKE